MCYGNKKEIIHQAVCRIDFNRAAKVGRASRILLLIRISF